ncbi:deoxythymidylate kinase-like protein [Conidiobolus coronatus NRRL 28638]|uniref:Thymidylate kinase n=1 Tax=Conidiobolus coronatus (strain ATCC 28846 / CBS 209.66 / NRRL 28638) TaxID=796925 RepID=A0A137P1J5_CONC2|nr:deoxythymidylate kinase-like protein [Conidiobolus coronatus NRRL 28638]|eukprot:KXN68751.1 deoxythymidylate kinase-like protein [Conidiobolus coronatus NRRL 28638]
MMKKSSRGLLIVVEGCDRSGKTTQTQLLANYLTSKSLDNEVMKFPDRTTELGKMINSYLTNKKNFNDQLIHLLFSSNRWEKLEEMENKLNQGVNLIVDRYAYSGAVFSSAKGLDLEWCKNPDRGLLTPDLVLFLDVDPSKVTNREGFGDERYEVTDFQIKVRKQFLNLKTEDWKVIDGTQSINQVQSEVNKEIEELLAKEHSPIKKDLWI